MKLQTGQGIVLFLNDNYNFIKRKEKAQRESRTKDTKQPNNRQLNTQNVKSGLKTTSSSKEFAATNLRFNFPLAPTLQPNRSQKRSSLL